MLNKKIIDIVTGILPQVKAIYLFGSYANQTATPTSDIDIALLCDENVTGQEGYAIKTAVSVELLKDCDIVDLRRASPVTIYQVLKTGHVIYRLKDRIEEEFEMISLSRYCALNEERRGYLEDMRKGDSK